MSEHAPKQVPNLKGHQRLIPQIAIKSFVFLGFNGAPGEIRTPDLLIRSQAF